MKYTNVSYIKTCNIGSIWYTCSLGESKMPIKGKECDVNHRLDMPAEYDTLRIGIKNMWLKDNYQGKTCYRRSINSMSLLKVNQAQNIC